MADLKEFQINGTVYNLKDETARNNISALQAAVGSPLVANTAALMVDRTKIYVYTGSETGYTAGHWYYYNGTAWTDGGTYQSQGIGANSVTGAKISDTIKSALLRLLQKVAFVDSDGQNSYTLLRNALYDVAVESISVVSSLTDDVYLNTSLDDLRQYITVTATYEDGTEFETNAYELSGTLTSGTSTITVSFQEKTATFTVNVANAYDVTPALSSYVAEGNTNLTLLENGFTATTKTNGTYRFVRVPVPLRKGYTYHVSLDESYTSGDVNVSFRDIGQGGVTGIGLSSIISSANGNKSQHAEVDVIPSESEAWSDSTSPSNTNVFFFITFSASKAANVTFTNMKIIEYLAEGE